MTISKKIGTSWTNSSASNQVIYLIGTCFGLGYLPKAPGTYGSIPGIGIFLLTKDLPPLIQVGLLFAATLVSIGVADRIEKLERTKDPQHVVIDEVLGMWLTLLFIWNTEWSAILIGFLLFRFFDILKPFPLNLFQSFRGGTGIIADDLAAGMLANLTLRIIITQNFIFS